MPLDSVATRLRQTLTAEGLPEPQSIDGIQIGDLPLFRHPSSVLIPISRGASPSVQQTAAIAYHDSSKLARWSDLCGALFHGANLRQATWLRRT